MDASPDTVPIRKSPSAMRGAPVRMRAMRAIAARAIAAGAALTIGAVNDPSSGISEETFRRSVLACAIQLQRDVAPEFSLPAPTVVIMSPGDARPAGQHVGVISVVGEIPNDPTAQGFHTPLGSGDSFDGYVSTEGVDEGGFSECLSHELLEMLADPDCQTVYTAADGSKMPLEPGDPCQAGGPTPNAWRVPIDIGDGKGPVWVANFTTKAWGLVGDKSGAKKDFLGLMPVDVDFPILPFGYVAKTLPNGTQTDVFGPGGELVKLPERKLHQECRVQVRLAEMRKEAA